MEEKLSEAEIEKLRAIVSMDTEAEGYDEGYVLGEGRSISKAGSSPTAAQKPADKAPGTAQASGQRSFDTELFVKVEEHAAIGAKLSDAKAEMKAIADTVSLLAKAEKLKSEAITRIEGALDKFDAEIDEIESKLATPEGLDVPEINAAFGIVSDDFSDLRSELDSLKSELGNMDKE